MKIKIIKWKEGLKKVGLNKYLRNKYGFSIAEAKHIVDEILSGNEVVLEINENEFNDISEFGLVIEPCKKQA